MKKSAAVFALICLILTAAACRTFPEYTDGAMHRSGV